MINARIVDLSHALYPGQEEYHLNLRTHNTVDLYPQYPVDDGSLVHPPGHRHVLATAAPTSSSRITTTGMAWMPATFPLASGSSGTVSCLSSRHKRVGRPR